jgi:ABC-type multidrug transport system fused ATPase/permease subunit
MYTIPPYLPHEEKTGLFSLPQHWRGIVALIILGITIVMARGAPSLLTLFFMSAPGLLAGAEFLPARLWQLRGWLRVASIIALVATVIFFGVALTQTRPTCTCKIRQIGSALS